jgi:hypothetical protein
MFREIFRTFGELWRDPSGRSLLTALGTLVAVGTIFYRLVEQWSWLDSFYFTMVTLTTVGYGDFHPTEPISKLFTVTLIVVGVSSILGFLNYVMTRTMQRRVENPRRPRSGDVLLVDGGDDAVLDGDPPGVEPHREQ